MSHFLAKQCLFYSPRIFPRNFATFTSGNSGTTFGKRNQLGDMLMVNAVETFDLVKQFDTLVAVDGINLQIQKGELFGLLGPNGAGKTTTLKMLITLLKPTSGRATVSGIDVVAHPDEVRKIIGYVAQESALDVRLTARENLQFFGELYNIPRQVLSERIMQVLKLVELDKRMNDLVAHYSGGMKRRLEIARDVGISTQAQEGMGSHHGRDDPLPRGGRPGIGPRGHHRQRKDHVLGNTS